MNFRKYFIFISIAILVLFIGALYAVYSDVKEKTIQDINISQTINAQQAASGIEDYVKNVTSTLNFLSRFPEIIVLNDAGKRVLMNYQRLSADEIIGVTRIDASGRILYTFPHIESIGKDVSSQEHIRLSLKTHEIVVSDVFTAVQGFRTTAVHVPVFKNGIYDGTLAFLLSFDKIAQKYINNIHVGKSGYAWAVSEKGIEISSPFHDHIGRDVHDIYKEYPEIISMLDEMLKGRKGFTTYYYDRNRETEGERVLKHAAYMPVSLGSTFWSLVVATPEDEILAALAGLRTKLIFITVILLIVYSMSVYLIIRSQVVIEEQRKRDSILTALRESEAHYRYLFEQNPMPMFIYKLDALSVLAVNDAFVMHYGYSKTEASELHLTDLYPASEKHAVTELTKKVTGLAYVGEWHHLKKDGAQITIEVHSHGISYNGHDARIAVINDITERKNTEEETKQLTQQLLKAEEIAHFGFLDWNLMTNEIFLSPEINRIYDIPNDVLNVADFITKVVHPDDIAFVNENLGLAVKGIKEYNIDHRIIRPNGKVVWLNAQAELYRDEHGKPIRLLGTILDITDRKLIQEQILRLNEELEVRVQQRTAQLEAANKELEAFSYSVSHDLRAPLRHTSGYVDLLVKKFKSDLTEKGQHYLDSIADSVHQMGVLIDDLLQFSKTGRAEMRQSELDMNVILKDVMVPLRRDNSSRTIEWSVDPLPKVFCDAAMMKLVWMNLLSNAVKFTKTREYARINISVQENDKESIFCIQDNGVGFDMKFSQKLFGVFQRLHSMEEFEGTGIGLANVRRIVSRHGGRTWVEAELDKGATFYFSLPNHRKEKS